MAHSEARENAAAPESAADKTAAIPPKIRTPSASHILSSSTSVCCASWQEKVEPLSATSRAHRVTYIEDTLLCLLITIHTPDSRLRFQRLLVRFAFLQGHLPRSCGRLSARYTGINAKTR